MLNEFEIDKYLATFKELKSEFRLYDIHVHPYEVITNSFEFKHGIDASAISNFKFKHSKKHLIDVTRFESVSGVKEIELPDMMPEFLLMSHKKRYQRAGPRLFKYLMDMCGIENILLLPVAPPEKSIDKHMQKLNEIYCSDKNFSLAYSVSNTIKNGDLN